MSTPAVGVLVLCGGQSARFGQDKAAALVDGVPMLVRVVRAMRAVGPIHLLTGVDGVPSVVASYRGELEARHSADERAHAGPVQALRRGMDRMSHEGCSLAMVVACDYPYLSAGTAQGLVDGLIARPETHAVVPRIDGRAHPLAAVYRVTPAHRALWAMHDAGESRVMQLLGRLTVELLDLDESADELRNVNEPGQLI